MLKSTMARGLAALLLGAMAVLAAPGTARAAVYVGSFDPAFGPAIPNLGFRGQGTFFVPDACLSLTGFVTFADCPGMSITSGFIDFYDTRSTPPPPTLVSQSYVPPAQDLIEILLGGGGNLLAVETGAIGPKFVDVPDTFGDGSLFAGNTWLEFQDGHLSDGPAFAAGAYLLACPGDGCGVDVADRSNTAITTFTRVPEPGSIGLVATALAIVAFLRRRRHQGATGSLTA
jgi:PEP-CTERM putative exosortase interaction domain